METLEYTITHKSYTYENDTYIVDGTVSIGPAENLYFAGSVYEKVGENDREYAGSFNFRRDGVKNPININDTDFPKVPVVFAGMTALLQKFKADGVYIEEESETLVEE